MTGRDRVKNAMHFKPPDKVPVQYYYSPVGYYEHGDKLNDLYETLPGDFGPFWRMPTVLPALGDYDMDGRFHSFRRDEWGTLWEYRIFGITGIPSQYPLPDITKADKFICPPVPETTGEEFENFSKGVRAHQNEYYYLHGVGSIFERLIALCPETEVLCEIELDGHEINALADKITEYNMAYVKRAVAVGADGIGMGDDYGTERDLIMSPETWRRFIKPRLRELFAPAVKANIDIHFHSCGNIGRILDDLREIGVTSIWPQLPAYNMQDLSSRCRSLGLAVALHTDRANVMTYGTPQDVRELVLKEYEVFEMRDGGAWFYIEADNGFPFENIEAMIAAIRECR